MAQTRVASLAPPSRAAAASLAEWRAAVRALPVDACLALAPLFDPTVLRARRLAERDAALVRMAISFPGAALAQADHVHRTLTRYAAAAWRFETSADRPHDPRNADAHRVLQLTDGKVPAARSIRRLMAAGQNSPRFGQPRGRQAAATPE